VIYITYSQENSTMLPNCLSAIVMLVVLTSLPAFSRWRKPGRQAALCLALVAMVCGAWNAGRAQQSLQVLHRHVRPAVSSGQAALVGPMPATQLMNLSIVMPLRNQDELTSLLGRLYDPSSPDYHQFLSVEQFTEQFGPTAEDYQAVVDFAKANGFSVTGTSANRLLVPITGTVDQIQKAFHVRMNNYQHPTEKRTFFSPDREPSLNLSVPVQHITGLNNYSIPRPMVVQAPTAQAPTSPAAVGSGPGEAYLGSDMRAAYYGGTSLTGSGQAVGLLEFDGYNLSDVNSTFSNAGQTYTVPINNVLLDGASGASVSGNDAEEVLDIVQAIGMAPGLSQVRVYIGNTASGLDDANVFNAMATENIAKQLSISWGWNPDDPSIDDFFFQEFAAQGQSVFVASGDYGAYNPFVDYFYPAEDAWVTAVGGTDLVTNGAGGAWSSETAWDQSGGGISPDGIPIPSWQAGVANSSNGGSSTLRNVPDVAAEADTDNYACNMGSCAGDWGGTSFAAPRWAGFMALVNQQAVTAGNSTVGFINPAIYAIGEGSNYDSDFHDITSGSNNYVEQAIFYAVAGYDLVTGWGSPAGQDLINALAPPAAAGFQLSASPSSLTINPGASGTTTISVRYVGGFTGNVTLSVSGLPSGVTAGWSTNPTSGSSVLTLTVSNSAIRGSNLVTITGTSGSVTATTTVALAVNAPGFSIACSSCSMDIIQGNSSSTTITVTDFAGFTGSVSLAVTSGLPSGVTVSFSPSTTTGSSTLTLTASNSVATWDSFMVTVTGTSGTMSATTNIALTSLASEFYLNVSPIPWTIYPGGSDTATVTVFPVGDFAGPVTLTAPYLPAGVSATFSPNPTTTTSVLTMTASSTATPETSWVEIFGSSSGADSAFEYQQTVTATPTQNFTVGVSPAAMTLTPGTSGTATVTVTALNGFTGGVTLSAIQLPNGITASFGTNPTTGTSVLTLTASSSAAAGTYSVSILGANASDTQSNIASFFLTITPEPGFFISASPASATVIPGTSATDTITVSPQTGFTGNVNLAAYGLPSGVTASFTPNPATGASVLKLTASNATAIGIYPVVITGTSTSASGIQEATTSIALQVSAQGFSSSNSNFGAVNIGTTSPALTFTFSTTIDTTLGSIAVLTQGATGLDFANAGTGTCKANTAYTAGESCTLNVTFTPRFAGARNGAVVMEDSNGNVLAELYIQGSGIGPQMSFLPGTESTVTTSGLNSPFGVAVDGNGNVYIDNNLNNQILKETLSGGIYTQSIVPTSSLNDPLFIAVDGSGNVYIADTNNYRVLKETPSASGYYESIVADLSSSNIEPLGVAVDGYGNVYFAAGGSVYVETLSASGYTQSTIPINSSNSSGVALSGVAVDGNGNIYVADSLNERIVMVTSSAGGYIQSTVPTSGLNGPWGVAVDGSGNIYIVDANNNTQVLKETLSAGSYTQSTLQTSALSDPCGVAVDGSGNVYIADTNNSRILKEDYTDPPSLTFASTAVGSTSSDSPQTVTVENAGNAALNFPVPSTGNNPSITANFTLKSNGTSACPLVASGSSTAGTLAAGASCQLPISFAPGVVGALNGTLVLTDSNLNAAAPAYATQSIKLSGTGTHGTPPITWATPAAITYGTALSATQLNASSTVAGSFSYSPAAGTVLGAGQQTLKVTFTPTDTTDYTTATDSVTLTVNKATPAITWATPAAITYGTALSGTQLDASSPVAGSFSYTPAAGTVLGLGTQTLSVTFTPTDTTDYTTATDSVQLKVNVATPAINWATPAAITYGTALSGTQLDASSPVAGSFSYSPAAGTVLGAGPQTLKVTFTPTDTTDYTTATDSVTLTVSQATPAINWATPAAITYGTALSGTQLDASSPVAGSLSYSPAAGTVLGGGPQTLKATFTPTDTTDYTTATDTVTLTVNKAMPANVMISSVNPACMSNPVTFTATISSSVGTPTGTVSFYDGTTLLGTGTLSAGVATYTTSALADGPNSITAAYNGDSDFQTVTSGAMAEMVVDFTFAPASGSGSATVEPGGEAVYTLAVDPPSGMTFPGAINFSVTGLPAGASSVFSPATMAAGSGDTNVTLTVTAPGVAAAQPLRKPFGGGLLPMALGLIALPFAGSLRRAGRRWKGMVCLLVMGLAGAALAAGLAGCGGGGSAGGGGGGGGGGSQSYTLTITATSGSLSHSTTVNLTVE
jgi:subtilase family serine protease